MVTLGAIENKLESEKQTDLTHQDIGGSHLGFCFQTFGKKLVVDSCKNIAILSLIFIMWQMEMLGSPLVVLGLMIQKLL